MDILKNRQGEVRNGWKALGFVAASAVVATVIRFVVLGLLHVRHIGDLSATAAMLAVGLLASLICLTVERRPFASIGYALGGRWARELGLGVAGGAGIMLLTALLTMGAGGFHWVRGEGTLTSTAWGLLLFVIVGFNEETMFRGYLFQRLIAGMGEWPAQLLMALFFAMAHWGNPGMAGATKAWATLNIALAAVLLGLCYLRTRSLALPIGVHIGWNFTQGNLLGFGVSGTTSAKGLLNPVFHGRPEWLTGGAFGLEAGLPCALVCGAAVLALVLWKGLPSAVPATATEA